MIDAIGRLFWFGVATERAIGLQRDGGRARIYDRVGDRKEIILIDLHDALERQALTVVIGQGDWGGRCQLLARLGLPNRVGSRQCASTAIWGCKAKEGVIAIRCSLRVQECDSLRIFFDCVLIAFQNQIVEAPTQGRHGAADGIGVNANALA